MWRKYSCSKFATSFSECLVFIKASSQMLMVLMLDAACLQHNKCCSRSKFQDVNINFTLTLLRLSGLLFLTHPRPFTIHFSISDGNAGPGKWCAKLHGGKKAPLPDMIKMNCNLACTRWKKDKKLSYCWETVRCESMPRIAEMDVEMTT